MIRLVVVITFITALFAVPVEVHKTEIHATYDDAFARNIMLPLSAAAYSNTPQQCVHRVVGGKVKRQITVKCDAFKGDSCSGFTALSVSKKAIIISFRGTNGFLQLLQEGEKSLFEKKEHFVNGGNVNAYFNDAFVDIWNSGLKNDFLELKNENTKFELWITGHSLGGSMASLAASYIAANGLYDSSKIKLVTFGQPRTGDASFATHHDSQFAFSFRVTHSHDLVPHIPVEIMGYTHHKAEVFYKWENMGKGAAYTVCSQKDEDNACSDGNLTDLSIADHLHYFDHDVSGYGDAGCQ